MSTETLTRTDRLTDSQIIERSSKLFVQSYQTLFPDGGMPQTFEQLQEVNTLYIQNRQQQGIRSPDALSSIFTAYALSGSEDDKEKQQGELYFQMKGYQIAEKVLKTQLGRKTSQAATAPAVINASVAEYKNFTQTLIEQYLAETGRSLSNTTLALSEVQAAVRTKALNFISCHTEKIIEATDSRLQNEMAQAVAKSSLTKSPSRITERKPIYTYGVRAENREQDRWQFESLEDLIEFTLQVIDDAEMNIILEESDPNIIESKLKKVIHNIPEWVFRYVYKEYMELTKRSVAPQTYEFQQIIALLERADRADIKFR